MPSTVTGCASRTGHLLDVHVEIRRDLLHVIEVFQLVEELNKRFGVLALDVHRRFGNESDLRLDYFDTGLLDRVLDDVNSMRIRRHHVLLFFRLEILGTAIECHFEDAVFFVLGAVDMDLSLAIEEIGHRIWRTEIAAESGELVANLGDGASWIVAQSRDKDCNTARSI